MRYLFSLAVPLLLIILAVNNRSEDVAVVAYTYDYGSFSELVEDCQGQNALGATCEAKCPGQGCACQTNIFKCNCYCINGDSGPGGPPQANVETPSKKMTLPSVETWEMLTSIVEQEDTELAKKLLAGISDLRELGEQNLLDQYDVLATNLDKQFILLQPATLDKFVAEFGG